MYMLEVCFYNSKKILLSRMKMDNNIMINVYTWGNNITLKEQ